MQTSSRFGWNRSVGKVLGVVGASALWLVACGKSDETVSSTPPGTDAGAATGGAGGAAGQAGSGGAAGTAAGGAAGSESTGGTAGSSVGGGGTGGSGGCSSCAAYGDPQVLGTVAQDGLTELSGIVESSKHPGVFFAHNDSGDSARFFAFDQTGKTIGEFVLDGATAVDWEDMAEGPCPAGTCLFLADIGDNSKTRASVRIFRVIEPDPLPTTPVPSVSVLWQDFPYSYQDGPHNAETLLAHPVTGDLFIITKEPTGPSSVYRIPSPASPPSTPEQLTKLTELTPPSGGNETTAGAIHPCGDRFLLRTYNRLWEYRATTADFTSAFSAVPESVPVAVETQGEAVTYRADGSGYVTASEGAHPALHASSCK